MMGLLICPTVNWLDERQKLLAVIDSLALRPNDRLSSSVVEPSITLCSLDKYSLDKYGVWHRRDEPN